MTDLSNSPTLGLADPALMPNAGDFPGAGRLAVRDPATGQLVAKVAISEADGARAAVDAADAAFPDWALTLPQDRAATRWACFWSSTFSTSSTARSSTSWPNRSSWIWAWQTGSSAR